MPSTPFQPAGPHRFRSALLVGLLAATAALTASPSPSFAVSRRLSFPPQAAYLSNGASINLSGYRGSLLLPASGNPAFSMGFTLPHDYQPNTPLAVSVLVETEATGCSISMLGRLLFRARTGQPRDLGSDKAGLEAVSATTAFAVTQSKQVLTFAAAGAAFTPVRFQYRIVPTPGEFATLQPGDAVLFTLLRYTDLVSDSCEKTVGVAGISVVYTRRATAQIPLRGRLSLDPFTAFDDDAPGSLIQWTGVEPPVRLQNDSDADVAAFAFTVPSDHKAGTPLDVDVLWASSQTGCSFVVSGGHLFRARTGLVGDHGSSGSTATGGLVPLDASTPFTLLGNDIEVTAPAIAHRTARLTFRIQGGGGFPALRAGDSVSFSLFRRHSDAKDTCVVDLAIAGVSIAYDRKAGQPTRDDVSDDLRADVPEDIRAEAAAKTRRLSLNPYAVATEGASNARLVASGFDPSLVLSGDGQGVFGSGFVLPDDYKSNSPMTLSLLVSTVATGCDIELLPASVFRARAGHKQDFGNAAGGLEPLAAATPFSIDSSALRFAAPPTAERTVRLDFLLTPTAVEFPTLKAGDAMNFSLYRDPSFDGDTCDEDLGIAGMSVLYTTK